MTNLTNNQGQTIKELLIKKSNDFSFLEKSYLKLTKADLLAYTCSNTDLNINKKISIIIPVYNSINTLLITLESINHQELKESDYHYIEVIIVDDGSTDDSVAILNKMHYKYKLLILKQNNMGAACARNLGAKESTGEILIFIDSDVILQNNFVKEHALRNQIIDNSCFVGFREHISPKKNNLYKFIKNNNIPNITEDVRFSRFFTKKWKRQHRECSSCDSREIKLIEETNYFKNFGEHRVLGAWDLPSMVQTFSISLRNSTFTKVGGFSLKFKGWGMEDTFLGASLIANGSYIVPVLSTGVFHIEHSHRSGSAEKKQFEFYKNVEIYNNLINKPL